MAWRDYLQQDEEPKKSSIGWRSFITEDDDYKAWEQDRQQISKQNALKLQQQEQARQQYNASIPRLEPELGGLDKYRAQMEQERGSTPSFLKPLYKNVLDPLSYGIENTLYKNPLSQRTLVKAGETLAGPGSMKNYDGSTLQAKDAGAIGNFLSDSAGLIAGMALTPTGGAKSLLGATDEAGLKASEFITKRLPQATPKLAKSLLPSMTRGAVDNALGDIALSDRDNENLAQTLGTGARSALGGAALFGLGKAGGNILKEINLPQLKGLNKAQIQPIDITPKVERNTVKISNLEDLKPITLESNLPYKKSQGNTTKPEFTKIGDILQNTKIDEVAADGKNPLLNTDKNGIPRSEQKIVSSSKDGKKTLSQKFNDFYTRAVDINNPIKSVDKKTYTLATNSKNVGGTVDYIFKDALVNREGKKIGSSLKELVEIVPKKEESDFWEYALQRHNISRATEGKNVYQDFTPQQSQIAVQKWEQLHPDWKGKADNVTKWIDDFMNEWGVNAGITDAELYSALREKYPSYLPTQRDFTELEGGIAATNGRGFIDQRTPIKKATGSERDIIDPVENIMNLVNRTVRTAKYNEVGQSLLDVVEKNGGFLDGVAKVIPAEEVNPNVNNIVTVLKNGKPVNLEIQNKQLLDSLKSVYKSSGDDLDNAFKKVTNVYKELITQKNPVFAIRNIARDIPTAYIYGNEANPLKFGFDLLKAGKDLATNSEAAKQYRALGGGGSNFFNSNKVAESAKQLTKTTPLQKVSQTIEKFNNIAESAPRLAEFKRTLKKTGNTQQALFDAADVTTNFSRGGDITKKADSYVPYLNASVQGLDKLARQVKNKPLQTAAKAVTSITVPTVALELLNKDNPDYQALDNRTKDNYFILPDANKDGKFIKIPKSRELGALFSSLFQRIERQTKGEKNAFKGFGNTLSTSFAPTNPLDNLAAPIYSLTSNKDFANRDIVPQSMKELSPQYQYDEKSSEISKWFADKVKELPVPGALKSPKQIDYLIRSYSGVVGQMGLPLATKSNWEDNKAKNLTKSVTTQFISDPLYSNQQLTDFYDNYDKVKTQAADKNFKDNVPSKTITSEEKLKSEFAKVSKEITDINKEIRATTNEDKIRQLRIEMLKKAQRANSLIK